MRTQTTYPFKVNELQEIITVLRRLDMKGLLSQKEHGQILKESADLSDSERAEKLKELLELEKIGSKSESALMSEIDTLDTIKEILSWIVDNRAHVDALSEELQVKVHERTNDRIAQLKASKGEE